LPKLSAEDQAKYGKNVAFINDFKQDLEAANQDLLNPVQATQSTLESTELF